MDSLFSMSSSLIRRERARTEVWGCPYRPLFTFVSELSERRGPNESASGEVHMRTQNQQEQWLVQWYDWFYRVKRYLALDPHITLSEGARAHLIYSVDQDAIAGEVFASQIP